MARNHGQDSNIRSESSISIDSIGRISRLEFVTDSRLVGFGAVPLSSLPVETIRQRSLGRTSRIRLLRTDECFQGSSFRRLPVVEDDRV